MASIRDVNIKSFSPLVAPSEILRRLPVSDDVNEHVARSRQTIVDILEGRDERLMFVVGPCSIHDDEAALEYAGRLSELAKQVSDRLFVVMRVYFEKPRTTIGWKGLIYDPHLDGSSDIATGLYKARQLMIRVSEMGLPIATEFLDPFVPQYISGLVSWAAIGARTTESQTHRQMASGLSMPVGFKNGTDGETQTAVDGVLATRYPHTFLGMDYDGNTCVVQTLGNPAGHIVLRGGRTGPNYAPEFIEKACRQLAAAGLPEVVLVDCSHGNSNKDHRLQPVAFRDLLAQRAAGDRRIRGIFLESNIHEGAQKLGNDPSELAYGISITDACIGWDETAALAHEAYEASGAATAVA